MIIVDPRRKIGFTLEEFEKLPEAERPTLYTRPMTAAEYAEVDELWSAHDNAATRGERVNALDTFLAKKLTGWERVQLPDGTTAVFGVHAPRVAFRYGQLVEAAIKLTNASNLSDDDRKKSSSPSASGTAPSAGSADVALPAGASA